MTLIDLIRRRRSVKHYDPNHRLTDEQLRALVTAGALAPTSFNMQNRHFVCVVDPPIKAELSAAAWGQDQVRDASVVIVLTGNRNAYKNTDRYLRNAPPDRQAVFEKMITDCYADNDPFARDEDARSVGLAAMNIMLMATDMGLHCGPLIGFDAPQVSDVVGLTEGYDPLMLVVVGKGTRPAWDRMGLLDLDELVSIDRFGHHTMTGPVQG